MEASPVILFFVRWPEVGRVKTRLAATMGPEVACRIHRFLAERTYYAAIMAKGPKLIICGTGGTPEQFREWLPGAADYWDQPEGDLGMRLETLFARAFAENGGPVIAIGSDCGDLHGGAMLKAVMELSGDGTDLYIQPATDGGYVLIGLKRMVPEMFRDMPWSTEDLLPATTQMAEELGLGLKLGPTLGDVDTEEDWNRFCRAHPEILVSGVTGRAD